MSARRGALAAWLLTLAMAGGAHAVELVGSLSLEGRSFPQSALYQDQQGEAFSIALEPELFHEWDRRWQSITLKPFFRWDASDERRTHFDLRQLSYLRASRNWELRVGVDRVFWGVTESRHLVDIINQTDLVENSDEEDKLGQPMVWLKWLPSFGSLDFFVLPGFRERTYAGVEGRQRFPLVVDEDAARYESAAKNRHVDFALRWSKSWRAVDLGVAHFHGTSREPTLLFEPGGLVPYYPQIDQSSVDAQLLLGGWLWKLEALRRSGQGRSYAAAVGGFEYTLVGLLGRAWDLGLLAEYHYDERGSRATTPFEDDLFVGGRWALNDVASTTVLAGAFLDMEGGATAWTVEASRRVGDRYVLALELRAITQSEAGDPLHLLRRDDYLQLSLERYF